MCPSPQNPLLPLENIACPEFQHDLCKTLFAVTCRDAAQPSQNWDCCPAVPNKITSSSENTVISSVHNWYQNPKSPARKTNSQNTKCSYFLNLLIFYTHPEGLTNQTSPWYSQHQLMFLELTMINSSEHKVLIAQMSEMLNTFGRRYYSDYWE